MWDVVLGACTVVGGATAGWQIYLWLTERAGQFGWYRVTRAVKLLLESIGISGYEPDAIVGLGRGGFVVAGMLSGNLGIITLAGLDRQYIWSGGEREVRIIDLGNIDVSGKEVLLVVAEPYTGETLRKAYEYLQLRGARRIKTASLFRTEACNFVPDYYAYRVKHVTKLPWRLSPLYVRDSTDPDHHVKYLKAAK